MGDQFTPTNVDKMPFVTHKERVTRPKASFSPFSSLTLPLSSLLIFFERKLRVRIFRNAAYSAHIALGFFFVRSFSEARDEGANSSIKLEGGEWRSTNLVISSYVNRGNDGNKSGWDPNKAYPLREDS